LPSLQLRDIARAILRRPGVILLAVLGFVVLTLGFTLFQAPPVYEASAKVVAGQQVGEDEAISAILMGMERREVSLIHSRPVAEETIQRLGLRMDRGQQLADLTVERVGRPDTIQLSYRDADRQRARKIAYTVAEVASERIRHLSARDDVTVSVWGLRVEPTYSVNLIPVSKAVVALIGALVSGLAAGIGLALLMERRTT
jgi:capsular polysaccharide biosynthesis protein